MKTRTTVLLWILFFAISLFVLNEIAQEYVEPREIKISQQQAQNIGEKIWQNEGAGKFENLVVWNKGEDFPSLGIGHFIWYPKNTSQIYQESFPDLVKFIGETQTIPPWLKSNLFPPWNSRIAFLENRDSEYTRKLRRFLQDSMAAQTQFMIRRLETALPKILREIKNSFTRMHVRENFYHVAMQNNGVYALVDYVNFKGEGISPKERYKNQGWGLLQVLEHMNNSSDNIMDSFVDSADRMLSRRVLNANRDESQWLPGWRKRLETYRSQ